MCIILTCEPGCRPKDSILETCFSNNPDGAGLMWIEDGMVQTSKGYDDAGTLLEMVHSVPLTSPLCIHMRIATSGGIDAGVCHPFPLCYDLSALHAGDVECSAALMHNGVIASMPTDDDAGISDTVSFVVSVVTPMYRAGEDMSSRAFKRRIRRAAPHNRFAILTSDGNVSRIGDGWECVDRGVYASNDTWRYDRAFFKVNRFFSYYDTRAYGYYDRDDDGEYVPYGDYYDDFIHTAEFGDLLCDMCGECLNLGTCTAYGPMCSEIAAAIDDIALERLFDDDDMPAS